MLTVNIQETVSNSSITPASLTFTSAGTGIPIQFSTAVSNNYYIESSDLTVSTAAMPASTSPQTATFGRSGDNVTVEIPITVPTSATAGIVTVNGAATVKPTLTWEQGNVNGGMVLPGNVPTGTSYYTGPYDAASTRTSIITYTCTVTEVLSLNSFNVAYGLGESTSKNNSLLTSSGFGTLTITNILPILASNTTATPVQSGSGAQTAVLRNGGNFSQPINITGDFVTVISNGGNVTAKVQPLDSWVLLNGQANATIVLAPGDSFTLGATANGTGAPRVGGATLICTNARITPLTNIDITINQA